MSPFDLRPRERARCVPGGLENPSAHAQSCTCPCPFCERMHRGYLERLGLIGSDDSARFKFVYALGHLRVSEDLNDRPKGVPFFPLYVGLKRDLGVEEPEPVATFGWIFDGDDRLRVVRAASDPWGQKAEQALADWAQQHEHTLEYAVGTH